MLSTKKHYSNWIREKTAHVRKEADNSVDSKAYRIIRLLRDCSSRLYQTVYHVKTDGNERAKNQKGGRRG